MLQEKCPPDCGLAVLHVHRGARRRILDERQRKLRQEIGRELLHQAVPWNAMTDAEINRHIDEAYDHYVRAHQRREVSMSEEPISVDEVISAHELLRNYEGDVHGLFAGAFRDPRFTEWLIKATCDRHGAVENTVSVEAGQKLSARQHVVCPQCLRGGITRRFIPQTVIRVEEEGK